MVHPNVKGDVDLESQLEQHFADRGLISKQSNFLKKVMVYVITFALGVALGGGAVLLLLPCI